MAEAQDVIDRPQENRTNPAGRHRRPGKLGTLLSKFAVVRDIAFVSFGKYGQYLITIVTLPLTARLLGAEGVGLLAIGMSAYFIGSLLVDLGITTFLAAMMNAQNVNQLRGNYLAVRGTILTTMAVALGISVAFDAHMHVHMIVLGLFAGGLSSSGEDWVLLGQGRFGIDVIYQSIGRIAYLGLLIVLLPRFPNASVAMSCLIISALIPVGLTWRRTLTDFGLPSRPKDIRAMLRLAGPVLSSRLLITSYGQGAATIYSGALSAASLGLYSASDRLIRALQSLLDAIGFGLLPRLARDQDESRFWRRSVEALCACVIVAFVAALVLWVIAPYIIPLIFGHEFDSAASIMRVQAFILPFTALTSFVTTAILPVRQDTKGVLIGAIIGFAFSIVAICVALMNRSVWSLVWGTFTCEVAVAAWYLLRLRILYSRELTRRKWADYVTGYLNLQGEHR